MTDRELYGDDVVYVPRPGPRMDFIIVDFWGPSPRVVRPWDLPDPTWVPRLDLFPRLAGLGRRVRRLLGWGR